MKLNIDYDRAGMNCFAKEPLVKRMVITYYRGTIMYANPYSDYDLDKRCG